MTAPVFEFTDRAVPIVQFGRSENRTMGDARWGRARWGVDVWGARDWEPVWTDLTCEIHEITTDTGRAGAVDRFTPGTAEIIASNVHGLSKMIWPPLPPPPTPFEFVPQPPIDHEENLEAPNATTLISNGWSFSDDFERGGPHWIFPPAWATPGEDAPPGPFKQLIGDLWQPEIYPDEGNAAAQWTFPYAAADTLELTVDVAPVVWPAPVTSGPATVVMEFYARMNTTTRACACVRVTYTPGFGAAANTISFRVFRMGSDGSFAAGHPGTHTVNLGATNGAFPAATFGIYTEYSATYGLFIGARHNGSTVISWQDPTPPGGNRIGLFMHFEEGVHTGVVMTPPRILSISGPDFDDDLTRPTGSGWYLPGPYNRARDTHPMIIVDGAMRPVEEYREVFAGNYRADGVAYFKADFSGDAFFEFDLTHMSMPNPLFGPAATFIEVMMRGNNLNMASIRCSIIYTPDWDGNDNTIYWELYQAGPFDDPVYYPDVWGEINLGATDGVFPEPATWRVEADTAGETRVYLNGGLLGTATFPAPPTGGRVGIWMNWGAGGPDTGVPRPKVAQLERAAGGLREPLGTEEVGSWVRIGVDHATLGEHWFFRGFVDGIVPTYIPDHADAVRIECIDSLGEAGRAGVVDTWLPYRFAAAPTRIRQLLNAAHWPKGLRTIHDDSTQMSRPADGKAVDGLTRVAESCGGAVYGDPTTGHIVFKGTDWQGKAASRPPLAVLTNFHTEGVDEVVPRVCPTGWELSKRRGDLLTRVRLTSETSETVDGDPIVKEWRSPEMEFIYGVELYEATVLAISAERINELAVRQLRVRGARDTPRVQAVLLDAATADEALDLMTTATFTIPSKYRCSHHAQDAAWAFNTNYLVTGVRHRIRPGQWTCRLALDLSAPFHETGGRWGRARWGVDVWGKTR